MIRRLCLVFLFFTSLYSTLSAHPAYSSTVYIDYRSDKQVYEVIVKIPIHDIGEYFIERFDQEVDFFNSTSDSILKPYVLQSLELMSDGKGTIKGKWIGREIENNEVLYCYIEYSAKATNHHINLKSDFFNKSKVEYVNLVHWTADTLKQSFVLTKDKKECTLQQKQTK